MEFEQILHTTVRDDIKQFNETRGKRRGLNPIFIKDSEIARPYKKFGAILDCEVADKDAFDIVRRVAHKVTPTLLRRKPRPQRINLDILEYCPFLGLPQDKPVKLIIRLVILR